MTRILRLLITAAVLIAIAIAAALIAMRVTIHGSEVQVPSLTGDTVSEAKNTASGVGLQATVDDRVYSTDVPGGHVVRQAPEAGSIVRHDWTVHLVESLGAQNVLIPSVLGLDERAAVLTLRQANLDVGTIGTMAQEGATPGTVVAQDPAPGAQAVDQRRVSIVLAMGAKTDDSGYVMPSLVGQSYAQAAATVAGAGLKLAGPATAGSDDASTGGSGASLASGSTAGTVIAQRPAAGAHVARGATVHLTVSP